ncbi:Uncharacterised protein [Candidatus Burarchaeum australiense]|nr:Uncharacterised protein [Candidatus Burarchaeum australiense]
MLLGLPFFELILKKQGKMAEIGKAQKAARQDPFEELVGSVASWGRLSRDELEERVRGLEVRAEDVERHFCADIASTPAKRRKLAHADEKKFGRTEGMGARKVAARNAVLECALCEWPRGTDIFSMVHMGGFEVVRVWSGRLSLTEYYYMRGRMVPYCVAELSAGAVASLPPATVYRVENRCKDKARTLHFLAPPPQLLPASEGIRRLYERRGITIV